MNTITATIAIPFIGLLFIAQPVDAVTFDRAEHVKIDFQGQNETRFISGTTVELTGELDGDVYVLAESLISKAVINGDLIGVVGTGRIAGQITGNIRLISSGLTLTTKGNNVTVASGKVMLSEESSFKDVFIASQQTQARGTTRSIHAVGSTLELSGTVTEQAQLKAERIILGPKTSIEGNLIVKSKHKPEQFDSIAVTGTREFIPRRHKNTIDPLDLLIRLFWILVLSYTLRSIPVVTSTLSSFTPSSKSILFSILALILVPIAVVLLLFTLIGLPLAVITGLLATIGFILTKPLFTLYAANLISQRKTWNIHLTIILASIAVTVLTHIPLLAPLFQILIFLSGWILAVHVFKELMKSKNTPSA